MHGLLLLLVFIFFQTIQSEVIEDAAALPIMPTEPPKTRNCKPRIKPNATAKIQVPFRKGKKDAPDTKTYDEDGQPYESENLDKKGSSMKSGRAPSKAKKQGASPISHGGDNEKILQEEESRIETKREIEEEIKANPAAPAQPPDEDMFSGDLPEMDLKTGKVKSEAANKETETETATEESIASLTTEKSSGTLEEPAIEESVVSIMAEKSSGLTEKTQGTEAPQSTLESAVTTEQPIETTETVEFTTTEIEETTIQPIETTETVESTTTEIEETTIQICQNGGSFDERSSVCRCPIGFHGVECEFGCTSYSDEFSVLPICKFLGEKNLQRFTNVNSPEECKAKCLQYTGYTCRSFEFRSYDRLCTFAEEGIFDIPQNKFVCTGRRDLYLRKCEEKLECVLSDEFYKIPGRKIIGNSIEEFKNIGNTQSCMDICINAGYDCEAFQYSAHTKLCTMQGDIFEVTRTSIGMDPQTDYYFGICADYLI